MAMSSGEAEHAIYAASGIIGRQGFGVLRHLDLSCFWLHQTMQSEESMADIGTTIQMRSILPPESGTRLCIYTTIPQHSMTRSCCPSRTKDRHAYVWATIHC